MIELFVGIVVGGPALFLNYLSPVVTVAVEFFAVAILAYRKKGLLPLYWCGLVVGFVLIAVPIGAAIDSSSEAIIMAPILFVMQMLVPASIGLVVGKVAQFAVYRLRKAHNNHGQ
ncbi:hypothetical protein AWR36_010175 [Microbulbifer flavimaris]|uniref:Uncharacterized protein n=1 Tax=Microbulbifer flavimaris TaxID=1781068 RepID=A0ABX4I0J5_9GAMM|nr:MULTISPECIES: hypothetical protein [Microbulbifer]KUJ82907.1 hypothetical protein AVO43_10145 [Microbulbifer sp. ZGT114]PCO05089.1 hypothetical protein AWR36_010175 [Microbulbifer flavimaris]